MFILCDRSPSFEVASFWISIALVFANDFKGYGNADVLGVI